MSLKVLILAEHKNGEPKKATLEALHLSAGKEIAVLSLGAGSEVAAQKLAGYGVKTSYYVQAPGFENYHPEAFAAAFEKAIHEWKPQVIFGSATAMGKDLLPKISARLNYAFVQDVVEGRLSSGLELKRPFFSGKALGSVHFSLQQPVVVSLRPNSFPEATPGSAGQVSPLQATYDFGASPIQFVSRTEVKSTRPDLTEANVVVSGGRSLKSRDNFKLIFDCADAFGGAAGASRAACDEGLADHDMQVGQTGKTVNPSLYIACGISGAIQHLAGMRTSRVIVAINKDAAAPIFSKASYGIVGDLFEVVPELTKQAKALLAK